MKDVFSTAVVVLLGAILTAVCSARLSRREHKWIAASFVMHVGFACAQVPLTASFFGGGDMFRYLTYGETLARMMEIDPLHVVPEVTRLLLHEHPNLPLLILGAGSGTGTMAALAAWTFYLVGPSRYAACVAFAVLSLSGKIAIYRVFRGNIDPRLRWRAAIAALFVPSFVFWSSGLLKEAVVIAGFGWSFLGLHLWIQEGRRGLGGAAMIAGGVVMALVKPYILFPFVLGGGTWYYWSQSLKRGRVRIRPARLTLAAGMALGGIVLLGQHFPEYSLDNFAEQASRLQQLGRFGGSAFALGDQTPSTLIGQFVYAPAALLTSLFRPFVFEAHNVPSFINALETTVLTLLFIRILFVRNLRSVCDEIMGSPLLVFCAVFVLAFGVAVGLASSNLGTLSRYRSPLLPFFVVLLLLLGKRFAGHASGAAIRRVPGGTPGAA
jgi:hypothetical protein